MNYRELNKWLRTASFSQVCAEIQIEMTKRKRKTFLKRLHQRYCALRAAKERKELGI